MSALSSVLGNVDISNAYIGTLTVGTSNIDPGAITVIGTNTMADIENAVAGGTYSLDVTVTHGTGSPTILINAQTLIHDDVGGSARTATFNLISVNDGVTLRTVNYPGGPAAMALNWQAVHNPPSGRSATTYRMQITNTSGGSFLKLRQNQIVAMVLKR